jgi:predicted RND superfamily exporter protein
LGIYQLRVSTFLIDDIPQDAPLKTAFNFFDREFGGSKPFEMSLSVREGGSIWDKEVLYELEKLHQYLQEEFGVAAIYSPLTLAKGVHQANSGGRPESFALPETDAQWRQWERSQRRIGTRNSPFPVVSEREDYGRLSARMPDIGSALALAKTEELQTWMQENLADDILQARVTGTSYLIDINNALMAKSTLQGLAVALLAIALVSAFLFRSWRMSVLAIFPNLVPILFIAGVMGFLGIPLKLSTAIIFTISFGIVVDDSIHFLSKLNIELGKGKPFLVAVRRTYLSAGKAIVLTSIILMGGFFSLMFSSFSGVFAIGLLVCLTLMMAVLLDLTLLPVLLSLLAHRLGRRSNSPSIGK